MSDYLTEPTLAEVFPATLLINGLTFTLDSTDNLFAGVDIQYQWGIYRSGTDWVIRMSKPDSVTAPTEWKYDQIAATDATGMNTETWALTCIVQCSTLWND